MKNLTDMTAGATPDRPPPGPCTPSSVIIVNVSANPDLDPSPGIQVYPGTKVFLKGSASAVDISSECKVSTSDITPEIVSGHLPVTWELYFQPLGGPKINVSGDLASVPGSMTDPTQRYFTANRGLGTYWADFIVTFPAPTGAETGEREITVILPPRILQEATGLVTFIRAHDLGTGYGPPGGDFIDVEAVIGLDARPDRFGFQLRNDSNLPARRAMFDLLRDAYLNKRTVTIDYEIIPGFTNGVIIRTWLT